MRPRLLLLALAFGLVACRGHAPRPAAELADLSSSVDALRTEFNAHHGERRFLTLLSPT